MATRLLMVVCILSALTFNRNCSCAAIIKTKNKANNFLGTPETPSIPLRALQMDQIKRLSETFASQMEVKRQLANTIQDQKESMNNLHASHRKEFFGLQDAKQQQRDTQLADEQVSQQALNNIMVVANEVDRLVQWKSVSLDTIINSNFPNLTDHLKMMISTAHANANILFNTQAYVGIDGMWVRAVIYLCSFTTHFTQHPLIPTRSSNCISEHMIVFKSAIANYRNDHLSHRTTTTTKTTTTTTKTGARQSKT